MHAIVIRSTGSWYTVRTDDGREVDCKVKGNFRLKGIRSTNPVAVGDGVDIIEDCGVAFIRAIDDRRNIIVRKASNLSKQSHILAANLDLAVLVATIARPETSTMFIDRFLAGAEAYNVPAAIIFNKIDELNKEEREALEVLRLIYQHIGYPVFAISASTGEGIDALLPALSNKRTLLAGHSGVGKSTLINRLIPTACTRTAAISEAHHTGMHTTTFSEMFALPEGGALIDIPGIKGFGTIDFRPEEVSHYFREIFEISADCRFNNCTHTHEPGCAVLKALEEHRISPTRYKSYLSIMEDKEENKYREAY